MHECVYICNKGIEHKIQHQIPFTVFMKCTIESVGKKEKICDKLKKIILSMEQEKKMKTELRNWKEN